MLGLNWKSNGEITEGDCCLNNGIQEVNFIVLTKVIEGFWNAE